METKSFVKNNTVFESFQNAFAGLEYLFLTQRNARIHLVATAGVFVSSILLKLNMVRTYRPQLTATSDGIKGGTGPIANALRPQL